MFNGMNGLEILKNWPRFEDGEPVRVGDEVSVTVHDEDGDFELSMTADSISFDEHGIIVCDPCHVVRLLSGERVRRPTPKALDADGVPIRVGERVRSKWSHDGWWYVVTRVESPWKVSLKAVKDGSETVLNAANLTHRDSVFDADGEPCEVGDAVWWTRNLAGSFRIIRIEQDGKCAIRDDDPDEPCGMTVPAGQLTHRAPVLAADGRPLREGEHVYHVETGTELVVKELPKPGAYQAVVVFAPPASHLTSFDPDQLTHERPDSWERLEKDANAAVCVYFGASVKDCENCDHNSWECSYDKARDIVRRCRALAERERGSRWPRR